MIQDVQATSCPIATLREGGNLPCDIKLDPVSKGYSQGVACSGGLASSRPGVPTPLLADCLTTWAKCNGWGT